jgi:cell division protein FtsL
MPFRYFTRASRYILPIAITIYLKFLCIVISKQTRHQVHSRMIMEVSAKISKERLIYRLGYADFGAIGL